MYRCLIVEDDPQVAKLNATYLAQEGFLVSAVAADASQALAAMEEQTFDLVLLDVFLPGMNGLELLRRLRATRKRSRSQSIPRGLSRKRWNAFVKIFQKTALHSTCRRSPSEQICRAYRSKSIWTIFASAGSCARPMCMATKAALQRFIRQCRPAITRADCSDMKSEEKQVCFSSLYLISKFKEYLQKQTSFCSTAILSVDTGDAKRRN